MRKRFALTWLQQAIATTVIRGNMKKLFSFLAGALCGAAVGAVGTLLFTPASGEDLRAQAEAKWQDAKNEAQLAMDQRQRELEDQFELARQSN